MTLAIKQTGPMASLAGLARGEVTRRYVDMQAKGLKRFCETARLSADASGATD